MNDILTDPADALARFTGERYAARRIVESAIQESKAHNRSAKRILSDEVVFNFVVELLADSAENADSTYHAFSGPDWFVTVEFEPEDDEP